MARVRQHVNPLKVGYLDRRAERLRLPAGREVEVEIGCAEAWFLFARAAAEPGRLYLGLEIRDELVKAVNARAAAEGAPVRALDANASVELEHLFAPASLARVYVNFPDPWFKRRHHKRRVMDGALAAAIARCLVPGGELLFQSDVWDIALDALTALEGVPALANAASAWSFWKGPHPYGARSRRELQCQDEGREVWRLIYRRVSG